MAGTKGRVVCVREVTWLMLAIALCMLAPGTASALSRDGLIRDLKHSAWGPKDGSPGEGQALAQTTDGYLWMGNDSGLFRFDGVRFEQVELPRDSRTNSDSIYKLYAPPTGGLWIGFTYGRAAFLKDGRLSIYSDADGLPVASSVINFVQDHDGTVWAATAKGLWKQKGLRWERLGPEANYFDRMTEALMVDSTGTLWAASRDKVLFLQRGETRFRETDVQPRAELRKSDADNVAVAESPTGEVWLFRDQHLRKIRKNENPGGHPATSGFGFMFDRDGALWIEALDDHIQRIAQPEHLPGNAWLPTARPTDAFGVGDGLSAPTGSGAMVEDTEGNVWIVSAAGLDRFSERNVRLLLPSANVREAFMPNQAVIAPGDAGAVWVGGRTFPMFSLRGDASQRYETVGHITVAFRTDDGTVWVGNRNGLWKFADGRFNRTEMPNGEVKKDPIALAQDREGALWIALIGETPMRWVDGAWVPNGGIAALPDQAASRLATDSMQRLWFCFGPGGVAVLDGGSVTVVAKDKIPVGLVYALYGKRSRVWIGGDYGVAWFDGSRFVPLTSRSGEGYKLVSGIVETADGDLWLNSGRGIIHIRAAELKRADENPSYRIQEEIFDALEGVQGAGSKDAQAINAIEGADGRLLFLTNLGLYAIDPARLHRDPVPPTVHVQSLTADDKTYSVPAGLQLPKGTTSVRIDYVGLNLTLPEKVHYRYKLEGVDKDWQDVQGRRQAFYTNLPPGKHRFQVIAANSEGVWSESGATLDFVISPTFVQTGWFIALCLLGAAAAISLLVRFRVRQLAGRMRIRYEERTAERERIARELHDTLLQGTQGLVLKVDSAVSHVPSDNPARAILEDALHSAESVMEEGRDRIQDLRLAADPATDLFKGLAAIGEDLAKGQSMAFKAQVEGSPRPLKSEVRAEAYSIGREALINAFQHARAIQVEVQVIYSDADFRLRVRDDGKGIDASTFEAGSRPGHWGLKGMRERAEKMGGTLDIWSKPDAGTEIELSIPASIAFPKRVGVARWWPAGLVARRRS